MLAKWDSCIVRREYQTGCPKNTSSQNRSRRTKWLLFISRLKIWKYNWAYLHTPAEKDMMIHTVLYNLTKVTAILTTQCSSYAPANLFRDLLHQRVMRSWNASQQGHWNIAESFLSSVFLKTRILQTVVVSLADDSINPTKLLSFWNNWVQFESLPWRTSKIAGTYLESTRPAVSWCWTSTSTILEFQSSAKKTVIMSNLQWLFCRGSNIKAHQRAFLAYWTGAIQRLICGPDWIIRLVWKTRTSWTTTYFVGVCDQVELKIGFNLLARGSKLVLNGCSYLAVNARSVNDITQTWL